ncbi:unnamed protein product [Linum tenue]|uniref:Homeobox-leucine zipper protein n=1 Tax=Linum tenue TaxID=586396 RepID=A0AAV0NBW9_9ROSI|nr:unnamed protein product [Linum tenue]
MDHQSGHLFFDPSACHGNMLFLGSGGDSVFRAAGQRTMLSMEDNSKRRPFFSSPGDFYDEEYYDEQSPEKKRRLSAEQVHLLEKSFETENKLEPERKTELAKKLGLQPRQVAVWFQNRRARWKTKQLERDYDVLKASYDSLRSNYDSVVKENEKLKSEVVSLTEKVDTKETTTEVVPISGENLVPPAEAASQSVNVKAVEDRLSTGSVGSAVVDDDSPQLVDSGDSYFPTESDYPATAAIVPGEAMQSEEDDGSDSGQGYYTHVFAEQHEEEGEALGWWVWS